MFLLLWAGAQVVWPLLSNMVPEGGAGAIYPLICRNVKLLYRYRAGSKDAHGMRAVAAATTSSSSRAGF